VSFSGRGRCLGGVSEGSDALVPLHCPDFSRTAPAIAFGGSKFVFPVCKSCSSNRHFS